MSDISKQALKPGKYAILFRNNWDGEGDTYDALVILDDELVWRDENGKELLEYEGDAVLKAWPMDDGANVLALLNENARLMAERDALRETMGGDNTRAAADIYFQLVEECEIPPGGSLVEYVDDMRDRLKNSEQQIAELVAAGIITKVGE